MKSNTGKIFIIIFCVICVIGVSIMRIAESRASKEEKSKTDVEATIIPPPDSNEDISSVELKPPEVTQEDLEQEEQQTSDLNDYLDPEQMENMDDSLYDENATDDYSPGMVGQDHHYIITNDSILSDLDNTQRKFLDDKLLYYLNHYVEEKVSEVTILEDSYNFDPGTTEFVSKADLDNGKRIRIKITFEENHSSIGEIVKQ